MNTAIDERGSRIVAQTSATPLIPLTRRRFEEIVADRQARLDGWAALTTPQRLQIELDEFLGEWRELQDFSAPWAQQRSEELGKLIADTRRKIDRWKLAEEWKAKHRRY